MEWQIKTRFNEEWETIVASKRADNKTCLSQEEYLDRIKKVIRLKKENRAKMSVNDIRFLRRFDVIIRDGRQRLVKPSSHEGVAPDLLPLYVTNQEMFDVLNEAYLINTNHRNEELLYNHIRRRYCNVTKEVVIAYLRLRANCDNPTQVVEGRAISSKVEQGPLPMTPTSKSHVSGITSVYFGFVDMRRYARNGYTCIMVHWNTATKFTHVVPLQNMDQEHVAVSLLKIYAKVGIPNFIDAPYDIPYITSIIDHIKSKWRGGDCCIKVRRSDDRDATIDGWNAVQKVLELWMRSTNFRKKWPSKLNFVESYIAKKSIGKVY